MKHFVFSRRSLSHLNSVHPDLVAVAKRALALSEKDFSITSGVRDFDTQQRLVREGKSKTLRSKHLIQTDGYGHAIDIVPYPVDWTLEKFYPIAEAFRQAAKELNVKIRWGGSWDIINETDKPCKALVEAYSASKRKTGQKAFIDAVHFELVK